MKESPARANFQSALRHALPLLGSWAARTITALPDDLRHSAGYRDGGLLPDGSFAWSYPHANSPERIEAFLYLARALGDDRYRQLAVHTAEALRADPVRGIYQGPDERARGGVWYWRDVGLYMTNYTMRAPGPLLALARATDDRRYEDLALLAGEFLLRSIQSSGIPCAGVHATESPPPAESLAILLPDDVINSRVGFLALPLAQLHRHTGEAKYHAALSAFAETLAGLQHADGSFGQDFRTDRPVDAVSSVKGHFLYYILNGVAPAARLCPDVPMLATIAERLGRFILRRFRQCAALLYGDLYGWVEAEAGAWRSATPDGIAGLVSMWRLTGDREYLTAARRVAFDFLQRVLDRPELRGATPIYVDNESGAPYLGGHFHFWLILGLEALEAAADAE